MKKSIYTVLVSIMLIALSVFSACSGKNEIVSKKKIVIATDATWPPMEFINDAQELVGFDIDLMKAAALAAGYEVEFKNTAWDGIFTSLEAGTYDAVCSSVTVTEERKATMDFSTTYVNAGQVLIVRKDTNAMTLADLKGKNVGAQIGTTGDLEVKKVLDVVSKTYDELGLAIEDLISGRIDGVVADGPTAASFILKKDAYKEALAIVGEPFTDEYYAVAVKKGNVEVLTLINKGIQAALDSGKVEELKKTWLK